MTLNMHVILTVTSEGPDRNSQSLRKNMFVRYVAFKSVIFCVNLIFMLLFYLIIINNYFVYKPASISSA